VSPAEILTNVARKLIGVPPAPKVPAFGQNCDCPAVLTLMAAGGLEIEINRGTAVAV